MKLIPRSADEEEIELDGKKIKLTNLDKVFWPEEITKRHLVNYYLKVAPVILPFLKDRPESLNRFPDGIYGEHFYHKNITNGPEWLETAKITADKSINYLLCQNTATLIYMVNLGCIEINPWSSRVGSLNLPDFMVIDLDPVDIDFEAVVETALATKKVLDEAGIAGFPKTSGASGMHIYVPLGAKYTYEQVKNFGQIIALLAHKKVPNISSVERLTEKRRGKVYIDYLQNNPGQTVAGPYSVRPVKQACISMPLNWSEVNNKLKPTDFTIKSPELYLKRRFLSEDVNVDLNKVLSKLSQA